MPSLKEIKTRIQSVSSTKQITSAMKMISSAKLRKAEYKALHFAPYQKHINDILSNYLSSAVVDKLPIYAKAREVKNVGIVVFASNSLLCGAYNSSLVKRMQQSIHLHRDVRNEEFMVFPVGKKVRQACERAGIDTAGIFDDLAENPTYQQTTELAESLMRMFKHNVIDRVKVIYFSYESKGHQTLKADTFLPVEFDSQSVGTVQNDYIIEPNSKKVIDSLLPKTLCSKMYSIALDAYASEQAARLFAMQVATENANDLLQELSVQYNKLRQQAITSELLDIAGGKIE